MNPAWIAGLLSLGAVAASQAADIDVVATQLAATDKNGINWGTPVLATDTTWTADNIYILTDRVYVTDGTTLTIEPGTRIYSTNSDPLNTPGDPSDDSVGSVIISRGAKIEAAGTANAPIIFDAIENLEAERGVDLNGDSVVASALGTSDTAKWGGLIVLGNASISLVNTSAQPVRNDVIEGTTPVGSRNADSDNFSDLLEYGYDGLFPQDDADDSGTLQYISIRHGGFNLSADNEINGLTLGGVGSGTTIDHIEVFANEDDGIEFFGGTVNCSHLSVSFCKDDGIDIDQGYNGNLQFVFVVQNNNGDNLGEWDGIDTNDGAAKVGNTAALPSSPQIWNATFVGGSAANGPKAGAGKDNGLYLDDNFNGALRNSIIHDVMGHLAEFAGDGHFQSTDAQTGDNPAAAATAGFQSITVGAIGAGSTTSTVVTGGGRPSDFYSEDFLGDLENDNSEPGQDPMFTRYTRDGSNNVVSIDPRPTMLNTSVQSGAPVAANYRGAFDSSDLWIDSWTALSEYGLLDEPVVDVVATQLAATDKNGINWGTPVLATDTTWTADNIYILTDRVYVTDGTTLTIEPGTRIYSTNSDPLNTPGDPSDDSVGSVIISRGAKIEAAGTANAPIIFDAIENLEAERGVDLNGDSVVASALGTSDTAKWGGLIVLGNASISLVNTSAQPVRNDVIEGTTPVGSRNADSDNFSDLLEYGYDGLFPQDDADDSGTLQYISIRHGGFNLSADNEINGLTLGGVGSGTTIDHIEVFANEDDGIEFFGGTVNCSHLSVSFCKDDGIDIDQGYNGNLQFVFVVQNNNGDNLGEWDGIDTNDGAAKVGNTAALPSSPQIWNATFVGGSAANGPKAGAGKDNGLYLDDNFNGALRNSIIHDVMGHLAEFAGDGHFQSTDAQTGDNPAAAATAGFQSITVGAIGAGSTTSTVVTGGGRPSDFYSEDFLGDLENDNSEPGQDPMFASYTRDGSNNVVSIDPRPTTLNTSVQSGAPVTANYRGAFDSSDLWIDSWTALSAYGYLMAPATDTDGDGLSDDDETNVHGTDPNLADTDGDGINDGVEVTYASLGFDPTVADAASVFGGLYTESSIQDLATAGQVIIQANGANVDLTLPVYTSEDLSTWTPAGDLELTIPKDGDKQFYRIEVSGAE